MAIVIVTNEYAPIPGNAAYMREAAACLEAKGFHGYATDMRRAADAVEAAEQAMLSEWVVTFDLIKPDERVQQVLVTYRVKAESMNDAQNIARSYVQAGARHVSTELVPDFA